MLKSVDHIEIIVRSIEETIRFYETAGMQVVERNDHHGGSVELAMPGDPFVLELHEPELEEFIGINHIAYGVDDMDSAIARVVDAGAVLLKGPVFFEPTGRTLANLRDPDGWRLQLVSHTTKRELPSGTKGLFRKLDHLDLYSRDVSGTAKFWRAAGVEHIRDFEHGGLPSVQLQFSGEPRTELDIHQAGKGKVVGINHLAFTVNDVKQAAATFESAGYLLDYPPTYLDATDRTVCTVRDPDGWRVQISQSGANDS